MLNQVDMFLNFGYVFEKTFNCVFGVPVKLKEFSTITICSKVKLIVFKKLSLKNGYFSFPVTHLEKAATTLAAASCLVIRWVLTIESLYLKGLVPCWSDTHY